MIIHTVKPGETIYSIAQNYDITIGRLIEYNGLLAPYTLAVGQTLVILYPKTVHTVVAGDSLFSIAQQYNTSVRQLLRNNAALNGKEEIYSGQSIIIDFTDTPTREVIINAYAYPFIEQRLLDETLYYITNLIPFTYGFTEQGNLVELDDRRLISSAQSYGTSSLMHISTLTQDGVFNSFLAQQLLTDEQAQQNLIENIFQNIQNKGYSGLDIDFEFIPVEYKENYVEFVRKATQYLNNYGYEVTVALAPKTSSMQRGLLYESHDYSGLAQAANYAFLMTYEWGYTYSSPQAVSPIENVRAVIEYALTQMPAEKIILGLPNYGYDWPLPYVKGQTAAVTVSTSQAYEIAVKYKADILYDEIAQAPYFTYTNENNQAHEIWFDDARSISQKLALIEEYSLYGGGYWSLMKRFPSNWTVLNTMYNVR